MTCSPYSLFLLTATLVHVHLTNGWVAIPNNRLIRNHYRRQPELRRHRSANVMATTSDVHVASQQEQTIKVLGVCGGIGSGKSQACKILVSELGCVAHIDADSTAHVVYEPGSRALEEITDLFGSDIIQENGEIDRNRLGSIVFSDRHAMSKLEQIVWPHIKVEIKNRIENIRRDVIDPTTGTTSAAVRIVVLEAAVLLDAGWEDLLDGLWVVTSPPSIALDRLVANRGLTSEEAHKRMDAQVSRRGVGNLPEEVANGAVTCVIENKGSLQDLSDLLTRALSDPNAWKKNAPIDSSN